MFYTGPALAGAGPNARPRRGAPLSSGVFRAQSTVLWPFCHRAQSTVLWPFWWKYFSKI